MMTESRPVVMSTQADVEGIDARPPLVALLRDLVHETTGLYYPDDRGVQLVERLAPLVLERGFPSLLDYYYLLKYDAAAAPQEWGRVFDALAVPETYFWREIDQLRALASVVVPRCVAALGGRPLRIWSIPCASGEEPLTLAMLLDEAGWFARAPIELHASDASPAAIARAQTGLYRGRSFRNLPPGVRDRYFTREGDAWRVSPALHARVTWSVVNLMDPHQVGPRAESPIILCRNLFIYFSESSIRQAVATLAARMPRPGYLAIGVSESLLKITNEFDLQDVGGSFMYITRA
jgi:chemotaxis protein methyltransferase CheR